MNLLLDAHIALWSLVDDSRLSPAARALISDPAHTIFWSVASMWEIAIKHSLKPNKIPVSAVEFPHFCAQAGFEALAIREGHIIALETLPRHHNDPFDRLLAAQAQAEAMILLTHGDALALYGPQIRLV